MYSPNLLMEEYVAQSSKLMIDLQELRKNNSQGCKDS